MSESVSTPFPYNAKLISKRISPCAKTSCWASASATILIVPSIEFSIGTTPTELLSSATDLMTSNKFDFGWKVASFSEKHCRQAKYENVPLGPK